MDPLEFLARLLTHIPDPAQVMTRYYGWYASRTRGLRRHAAGGAAAEAGVAMTDPVDGSLRAARYRWAELLRHLFETDPLTCPRCAAPLRIVAVITDRRPSPASSPTGPESSTGPAHPGPTAGPPPAQRRVTPVAASSGRPFPFGPAPQT